MPPLLHDRYLLIDAAHACDLATGDVVAVEGLAERRGPRDSSPPALLEVFDHGRDGEPRAVAADLGSAGRWKATAAMVARDAVDRGYIPIDVSLYCRLRSALEHEVSHRTLALLASDRQAVQARAALLDAAARAPRPHVLLTIRTGRGGREGRVSEARAAYGPVQASRPMVAIAPALLPYVQRASRANEFVAAGRHAAAERLLRDVAHALIRRSAWPHAVPVLLSLGRLLLERGRTADSVKTFSEAVALAGSAGDRWLDGEARIWLATARTDAADLTAAESVCRSLLLIGELPPPLETWTRAALIRVLLWQNRVQDAVAVHDRLTPCVAGLDSETDAFIRSTTVRLLLRTDRVFEAGVQAGTSLDAARDGSRLGWIIALTSHLRVLAATGDMTAGESRLQEIRLAIRAARAPLRLARARLIWTEALRRAGRLRESDREIASLSRVSRVAPPLVRLAIDRQRTSKSEPAECHREGRHTTMPPVALVLLAQEEEDDGRAVERLLEVSARHLRSTRIDVWSADAGPASVVRSAGTGLATTIGGRVIDAGIPVSGGPPPEVGVPVRLGSRVIGALVARWPADRVSPSDAAAFLEFVAAVAAARLDALLHRARIEAEAASLIPELVGVSRVMADVRHAVARAAAAPFSVLVEGESGVGKELIARAVHYLSPRRERRFCDVNCAALPDDLLESELFGHAKGAFTGAVIDRAGLFEDAHGGTLFLDEIADLSLRAQAKLLRVLQQQEIRRVGETFARPVDVRLVSAANRDMRAEASGGRFRQDLLYRIDVIRIDVPALRQRPEDIPILAAHFWRAAAARVGTLASLSPAALAALAAYHWPGNVRELQNVIAALAVAAPPRGRVSADLLPAVISGAMPIRTSRLADARIQFERRFVEGALARAGGNRARAARALGLSRQGLAKLLDRLDRDR